MHGLGRRGPPRDLRSSRLGPARFASRGGGVDRGQPGRLCAGPPRSSSPSSEDSIAAFANARASSVSETVSAMHIPPYDNQNRPIVDVDNLRVSLNYFNIAQAEEGRTARRVPDPRLPRRLRLGRPLLQVPATGTVDIDVAGQTFEKIGKAHRRLGRRARARAETRAPVAPASAQEMVSVIVLSEDLARRFVCSNTTLEPFAVRADELDKVQYDLDGHQTHRKPRSSAPEAGRQGRARIFVVCSTRSASAPGPAYHTAHKHDTDRLPDEPRTTRSTIWASGGGYGSGLQMLQREDNKSGDAYHIVDGSTILQVPRSACETCGARYEGTSSPSFGRRPDSRRGFFLCIFASFSPSEHLDMIAKSHDSGDPRRRAAAGPRVDRVGDGCVVLRVGGCPRRRRRVARRQP